MTDSESIRHDSESSADTPEAALARFAGALHYADCYATSEHDAGTPGRKCDAAGILREQGYEVRRIEEPCHCPAYGHLLSCPYSTQGVPVGYDPIHSVTAEAADREAAGSVTGAWVEPLPSAAADQVPPPKPSDAYTPAADLECPWCGCNHPRWAAAYAAAKEADR